MLQLGVMFWRATQWQTVQPTLDDKKTVNQHFQYGELEAVKNLEFLNFIFHPKKAKKKAKKKRN